MTRGRTWALALIASAALLSGCTDSKPAENTTDPNLTMADRTEGLSPRLDVLTASLLSSDWDQRDATAQEVFCLDWTGAKRDAALNTYLSDIGERPETVDMGTAQEFFDYACAVVFSDDEIGTAVTRGEVGSAGAELPKRNHRHH